MATSSVITEEMRKSIGVELVSHTTKVELGAIKRFAEAIGDTNPLYHDEVQARKSRYGSVVAPPTFYRSLGGLTLNLPFAVPLTRVLDGGTVWEYFEPVRPGDAITASAKIADLSQRSGRMGTMLFIFYETAYKNQLGQLTAKSRSTIIRY